MLIDNICARVYILATFSPIQQFRHLVHGLLTRRRVKEVFRVKRKLNFRTGIWVSFAAIALLSLTAGAGAIEGDKKIRMYDDCEPTTFNAVLGDGACIGSGAGTAAKRGP